MDKKIIPALVLLFALMLLWPVVDRKWIKPLFPAKVAVPVEALAEGAPEDPAEEAVSAQEAPAAAQPAAT
ncbi:MAG: hypothetical protein PHG65_10650, partial [Kiritimatiellae bacterium]|nr:hypothetical protein [Kiritimatiellia bacterium]